MLNPFTIGAFLGISPEASQLSHFLRSTVQILAYHLLRASENMVLVIGSDLIMALFGNR